MVKITDRIKRFDGVANAVYDFDNYKLIVTFLPYTPPHQREEIKFRVVKLIGELQLQDSIKNYEFIW